MNVIVTISNSWRQDVWRIKFYSGEYVKRYDRYRNISLSLKNVMFVVFDWYSMEFLVETNRCVEFAFWLKKCWNGWNPWIHWIHWIALEGTGLYWKVLERVVMPGRLECHEWLECLECHEWLECPCRTGMPVEGLAAGMPGMPCRSL